VSSDANGQLLTPVLAGGRKPAKALLRDFVDRLADHARDLGQPASSRQSRICSSTV